MRDYLHFLQEHFPWLLRVVAFYMGACVGSFLNVCILRIPAGRSIVTPRSHCACGQLIAWYDNIPILSWFILRGRARCCGRKFSIRYSLIEAATAGVYLWLWMALPPATAVAGMVFFSLLLLGAMIDLDCLQLPDVTTIGGLLTGLALSLLWPQIHGLHGGAWTWAVAQQSGLVALTGAVAGAGFIYWIGELGGYFLRKPAMGYGDMLLMGCIGAFCGWRGALASLFIGTFAGLFAIILFSGLASLRSGKKSTAPEPPPDEVGAVAAEPEVNPLGRRIFAVGFLFLSVLIAALHSLVWMSHNGVALLNWPGAIYLGVIFVLTILKRSRFTLSEPWLVLAVFVGVILSAVFPRMQGVASTELWFVNAIRGGALAAISAVIGAGVALWVMEFANLARHYLFPNAPAGPALDDYHQIAGEGYLLLFGSVGAFCGWRTAVVAALTFAIIGSIQAVISLLGQRSASISASAPSTAEEAAPSDTTLASPSTWSLGQEIPFGPSLALGGFLYYAWPWLHLGVDRYVLLVHDTFFGN
jgi:leader peptidase (prepilin peptidase) / N-methyltransferase